MNLGIQAMGKGYLQTWDALVVMASMRKRGS
jgi:hypothetical protein